jgi:hypothetical protein
MQQECQFKACHHCYRRAAEKAWLSLDGIVNGDIPPTAASAYSFHYMQQRPICNASVVSNLGYRAVPLVSFALKWSQKLVMVRGRCANKLDHSLTGLS